MAKQIKPIDFAYLLLSLVPILHVYSSPLSFVSLGEVALAFSAVLIFLFEKKRNEFLCKKGMLFFYIYGFLITLVMIPVHHQYADLQTWKEFAAWVIYACLFLMLVHAIDLEKFLNVYVIVALLSALFLIVQFLVHQTTGRWIPGLIPNVGSSSGGLTNDLIAKIKRPSGFFSEPAHFAQFMAIPLMALLFKERRRVRDLFAVVIVLFSILLTYTGNGLLVIAIAFLCYLLRVRARRGFFAFFMILASAAAVFLVLYNSSETVRTLFDRFDEITGQTGTGHLSGYIRVIRGYIGFANLNIDSQIFGLGIGIYHNVFYNDLYAVLSEKSSLIIDYLNGTQYYLISLGAVGLFPLVFSLAKVFVTESYMKKGLSLSLFGLMCVAAVYSGWLWLFLLISVFAKPQEDRHETHLFRRIKAN